MQNKILLIFTIFSLSNLLSPAKRRSQQNSVQNTTSVQEFEKSMQKFEKSMQKINQEFEKSVKKINQDMERSIKTLKEDCQLE